MSYLSKSVSVLGSTGSVGTQALDVIRELRLPVKLLSGHRNVELLAKQALEFSPETVVCADAECASELKALLPMNVNVLFGTQALCDVLESDPADITVHSIAGLAGIPSAISASRTGTRLAMANKEAIICAGDIILSALSENGGELIPVDSEHSAIFQCLCENMKDAHDPESLSRNVSRILLTASGGPFFGWSAEKLSSVTPEMALAHPTWKMGPKITIDSATLMNKGFEIVEAIRLFGVASEQVEVVVHRQSIIHSMVEYIDNTVIAQLGAPDMRSAVRYAISYPDRVPLSSAGLDFPSLGKLTFDAPDICAFPLLNAGRDAYSLGGTALCSLIAADEAAVEAFLGKEIGFAHIPKVVYSVLEKVSPCDVSYESLLLAEQEARAISAEIINKLKRV